MADARRPYLSDDTKARIRAEEEARLQAKLEEEYREEVRAELEREHAESQAPTEHDRPALPMGGAARREVGGSSGPDRVRVMGAIDPSRAPVSVRDTVPHLPAFEDEPPPWRRSRLRWWALCAVVLGLAALGFGLIKSTQPRGDEAPDRPVLRGTVPATEVDALGE